MFFCNTWCWYSLTFLLLLLRGVVWCGVVWCGVVCVVWCGLVWCGVVWCGVVWCGVVCVVWCGVMVDEHNDRTRAVRYCERSSILQDLTGSSTELLRVVSATQSCLRKRYVPACVRTRACVCVRACVRVYVRACVCALFVPRERALSMGVANVRTALAHIILDDDTSLCR